MLTTIFALIVWHGNFNSSCVWWPIGLIDVASAVHVHALLNIQSNTAVTRFIYYFQYRWNQQHTSLPQSSEWAYFCPVYLPVLALSNFTDV